MERENLAEKNRESEEPKSENRSSFRTLLTSVLFSMSGPIVLGLGLMVGRSSTQIADFARRTAELIALVIALITFCITENNSEKSEDEKEIIKKKSNILVGIIMCVSGLLMLLILLVFGQKDKGNVIPALVIALLGVTFNSFFFFRYAGLYKKTGNSILEVQGRLYGAKSLVDLVVTSSLMVILFFPKSDASAIIDRIGTFFVSAYMLFCGIRTIRDAVVQKRKLVER